MSKSSLLQAVSDVMAALLFVHIVQGLPLGNPPAVVNDENQSTRTTWEIFSSCVATIFACTWVSIHPNIPGAADSWPKVFLRRLQITFLALVAPELIVAWAMRQWLASRKLANTPLFGQHKWTQTHGYFASMGGFSLLDGETSRTLLPNELIQLTRKHEIDLVSISEKEISDRSKGDALSKGLVVLQTGWFAVQCLARKIQGLPLAEFELLTLAYVIAMYVIHGLWWNKPLDVQCPVLVKKKFLVDQGQGQTLKGINKVECIEDKSLEDRQTGDTLPANVPESCIIRDSILSLRGTINQNTDNEKNRCRRTAGELVLHCAIHLSESICFESTTTLESLTRVPTFYSGPVTDEMRWLAGMAATLVAAVFGAIHCTAWSAQFPSFYHQQLWRVCSIIIIVIPTSFPLVSLSAVLYRRCAPIRPNSRPRLKARLQVCHGVVLIIAVFAYVIARVILIIQATMLLESLPPGAFQAVRWTTFIPHL